MYKYRLLYLYSKLPPYQIQVLRYLSKEFEAKVDVIYWSRPDNAPYIPPPIDGVSYYPKENLTIDEMRSLINDIDPHLIFISGWQDKDYMKLVLPYRKRGIPIVIGFDDIWKGSMRQWIGRFYYKFWLSKYYTHAWVSGPRQYEFAKKLFFKDSHIISNLYSCDVELFSKFYREREKGDWEEANNFLFVGRFARAKSIDVLIRAFDHYKNTLGGNWNLICIGKGDQEHLLLGREGVKVYSYMSQSEIAQLLKSVGAFVLASRVDVSPLVVHEFSSAGLPLILSDAVGNRQIFLINNYNGLIFQTENHIDLANKMMTMSKYDATSLSKMGANSHKLSRIHDPEFVAASLISLVK